VRQWRSRYHATAEDQLRVAESVAEGAAIRSRYSFMIMMACGIAILGLLQNSVAVIIGAMLISPLMGPIVALGFSLCLVDYSRMWRSLLTLAAGVAMALAMAVLVVLVSPLREATPEILARTQPNLFDLLVAVFSGLAGGFAVVRGRGETIVGVAIATALMPPLAVVGFGIATGQASIYLGAGFLFMTNLLAIALSVTLVAKWFGFGTHNSPQHTVGQLVVILVTFVALSAPLGISLLTIAQRSVVERAARTETEVFLGERGARMASLRITMPADGALQLDVVSMTPQYQAAAASELKGRLDSRLGRPVEVSLQQIVLASRDPGDLGRNLEELRASLKAIEQASRARDPVADYQSRLAAAVGGELGAMSLDAGERRVTIFLQHAARLSLQEAEALEARLAGVDSAWTVRLVPFMGVLPAVSFEPASAELTAEAGRELGAIAWGLRRWGVEAVEVTGYASIDGSVASNRELAERRAQVVAEWLRAQGFEADTRAIFDRRGQAAIEREFGHVHFRRVEIRPQPSARPLPGPAPGDGLPVATGTGVGA
jgi:uncharacterized hydrophobic protein (TIGR00271 family)